ncbi:hypothetical protein EVAR_98236_1 [Eumeta japonica]|uniref:Uncharacterized protein n=1 Tax=Eumeta variegata TaxID=151549 RepID=A0A4C1Y438_EUMVA|nr:hypothetical protein EVAR_98236_1 [Eumeta japonica]
MYAPFGVRFTPARGASPTVALHMRAAAEEAKGGRGPYLGGPSPIFKFEYTATCIMEIDSRITGGRSARTSFVTKWVRRVAAQDQAGSYPPGGYLIDIKEHRLDSMETIHLVPLCLRSSFKNVGCAKMLSVLRSPPPLSPG